MKPSTYQRFKLDVVARLPQSGWTLSRGEVLDWLVSAVRATR
jgi:hypothetical protein